MSESKDRAQEIGTFAVRIVVGLCFLLHGLQKVTGAFDGMGLAGFVDYVESRGVIAPTLTAYVVAFGELLAGVALLVGFFHRIAAIMILVIMAGAFLYVTEGYFLSTGFEYNLALAAMALLILLSGPGAYAYRMELKKNSA